MRTYSPYPIGGDLLNIAFGVQPSTRWLRRLVLATLAVTAVLPPPLPAASSSGLAAGGLWLPQGPGPTLNGQVEGLEGREVVGAIETVAANPHTPSQM